VYLTYIPYYYMQAREVLEHTSLALTTTNHQELIMATNTLPQSNSVEDIEKAKKLIRTFYRLWVASELSARFYKEHNLADCEGTDTESEALTALLKDQYRIGAGIGDELDNLLNVLGIKDLDYSSHRQEGWECNHG